MPASAVVSYLEPADAYAEYEDRFGGEKEAE